MRVHHPGHSRTEGENIYPSHIEDSSIIPSHAVWNLGVVLDDGLTMEDLVCATYHNSFYYLRCIRQIRRNLTDEATVTGVHALVTSRLDANNALLYGISQGQMSKLQRVQNSAARVLTHTNRRDHITPILKQLHWLTVKTWVEFKLLCIVFKARYHLGPSYLSDLLVEKSPTQALRSHQDLMKPKTRLHGDKRG